MLELAATNHLPVIEDDIGALLEKFNAYERQAGRDELMAQLAETSVVYWHYRGDVTRLAEILGQLADAWMIPSPVDTYHLHLGEGIEELRSFSFQEIKAPAIVTLLEDSPRHER